MTATPTPLKARLAQVRRLPVGAAVCAFEVANGHRFDFEAGQHVCLRKSFEGALMDRYYSIASAPSDDGCFELCINFSRDRSPFGDFLRQMQQGDEIDLLGPSGNFRLREPARDSVFIASGAGISPLRSMIQQLLAEDEKGAGKAITLLYGARRPEGLFFANEFEEAARRHSRFRFLPTLSRGGENWTGLRGYVQEHVDDALRLRAGTADIYLCGQPEMVRDVRALLERAGVDESAVHYEKYE